jgi:hypothetical protein
MDRKMSKDLVGLKQMAAFFGISVARLKQLITDGDKHPARGVNLTRDLLSMNDQRSRYLPLPLERARLIKNSIIAIQGERSDSLRKAGRFAGKEYRVAPPKLGPKKRKEEKGRAAPGRAHAANGR